MNLSTGPTAPTQACAYEYTVKRGDSYYLISKRLGVSLRDLIAANPNINPARLMVGDVLCIPMVEGTQQPAQEPQIVTPPKQVEYPPMTGETGEVEGETGETAPPVEPPTFTCPLEQRRTVQPGQTVSDFQLNAGLNRHTMEVANPTVDLDNLVPGQVICVPDVNQPCPLPSSYILQPNDTLETVAAKFNLSIASLLRANPCLAPADFLPCVCINLPS
jgi:LysM repeat protein